MDRISRVECKRPMRQSTMHRVHFKVFGSSLVGFSNFRSVCGKVKEFNLFWYDPGKRNNLRENIRETESLWLCVFVVALLCRLCSFSHCLESLFRGPLLGILCSGKKENNRKRLDNC